MPDYPQLLEALERGALVLFLGADLPRAVTGLPSRAELARGLAERHGVTGALSLAQVAQRVSRAGNRFDFTDYLRRELDTAGKPVPAFYRGLAAFAQAHSLPAIVATAYDDFLDRALRDAGVPCDRLVRGSDVAFARPDRLALLKLYGDAQLPDTLVVTEDDHYGLWRDRDKEMLLDEVRRALQRNAVLFLGYNLSDPDFHLLWREVLDKLGRFARTAYAVWPGLPDEEQRVWRDRSIQVLESDPWGLTSGTGPAATPGAASPVVPASAPATPIPAGLGGDFLRQCRAALLRCAELESNAALRAVFVTAELAPFRNGLPEAESKTARVDQSLAYLQSRQLRDGRAVLPLFLAALAERYDADDVLHGELHALAQALAGGGGAGAIQLNGDFGSDVITGNTGPTLSGQFSGPVAVGGGEAVDFRGSQGANYKPAGPVTQHFGEQIHAGRDVTTASGERSVAVGADVHGSTIITGNVGHLIIQQPASSNPYPASPPFDGAGDELVAAAPPASVVLILRLHQGLQRLDAVEIETLCLLHAPEIQDKFGRGQRRDEMINTILEHCRLKPENAVELVKHLK